MQGLSEESILIEFTSSIAKTNRNVNFKILFSNNDYIEWIDLVYQFTLEAIKTIPSKIIILNNLMLFWSQFVFYALKLEAECIPTLKQSILMVY